MGGGLKAIPHFGDTVERLRDYEGSLEPYQRSIELNPTNGGYYSHLARALIGARGDFTRAWRVLEERRVAVDDPGRPMAIDTEFGNWSLHVLDRRDYDGALAEIRGQDSELQFLQYSIRSQASSRAFLRLQKGELELARTSADLARNLIEPLAIETPDDPRVHISLGMVYAILGRTEDAVREGLRAVELMPVTVDAMYGNALRMRLSNIYVVTGRYEEALGEMEYLFSVPSRMSANLLKLDPFYDVLRDHPRFQALVR